jgi:hypothetical protein
MVLTTFGSDEARGHALPSKLPRHRCCPLAMLDGSGCGVAAKDVTLLARDDLQDLFEHP